MAIILNKEICIGCGTCAGLCPLSFSMAADGKAEVIGEAECASGAAESCPVEAISIQ